MFTCTVFELHLFSVSSHTGIGIGIGYWRWVRPILLGIGCLAWYRSNPSPVHGPRGSMTDWSPGEPQASIDKLIVQL